jgi:hypothetical protein
MQPQIIEPPFCGEEGHGMMIPLNAQFGYVPARDGLVTALVTWYPDDILGIEEGVFAPTPEMRPKLPSIDQGLGEAIYALQQAGQLFLTGELYRRASRVYRIDDRREGRGWSYVVSLDDRSDGLRLMPRTVYHFVEERTNIVHPRLTEFDDVVALLDHEQALVITDMGDLQAGTLVADPEVRRRWDFTDRIVVWDGGAIQRNTDARYA